MFPRRVIVEVDLSILFWSWCLRISHRTMDSAANTKSVNPKALKVGSNTFLVSFSTPHSDFWKRLTDISFRVWFGADGRLRSFSSSSGFYRGSSFSKDSTGMMFWSFAHWASPSPQRSFGRHSWRTICISWWMSLQALNCLGPAFWPTESVIRRPR